MAGRRSDLTQSGVTMGTPLYMSPEQAQGHPLDHRSDLYSLGVTYYFMMAGEPPFRADSAVALALKHVREIPRSLMNHRPDLPLEIDRLVMKLMAKDPADRYQSAADDAGRPRQDPRPDPGRVGRGCRSPYEGGSARTEDVGARRLRNNALAVRAHEPAHGGRRPPRRPVRPARVAATSRRESAGPIGGGPESPQPAVSAADRNGGHGGRPVRRRPGGLVGPRPGRADDPDRAGRGTSRASGSNPGWTTIPKQAERRKTSCAMPCSRRRGTSGPRPGSPSRGTYPHSHDCVVEGLHPARPVLVSPG